MLIRCLTWAYSVLLVFHDRKLREHYGEEMIAVFGEQLGDRLQEEGRSGVLREAGRAFGELATIALPARVQNETAAVVSAALLLSVLVWIALCRILVNPDVLDPWLRVVGLQC
jgi:hypothetical protein